MKQENEKKKVILMIVGVIALILVVIGATFAYFNAQIGKGENTKLEATTETTDSLTFNITDIDVTDSNNKILDENNNEDANIVIYANQGNFAQNGNSLGDGVNLNAHLIANNTNPLTASYTYNVYLDINKNDLEYTSYKYEDKVISFKTKEEKEEANNEGIETEEGDYLYIEDLIPIPELVLVVQKPNGEYLNEIKGLTKSEITIGEDKVPCFDITEINELITITSDYPIEATKENKGIVDQNWQIRVIFKNLETDQHLNTDKSFLATLSIQSEKINYLTFTNYANCNEYNECFFTDYRYNGTYNEENDEFYGGYNNKIKNVYFVNKIVEEELNLIDSWDLSSSQDGSIMAWLKENQDPDVPYDLYIGSNLKDNEKIKVRSLAHAFEGLSSVESINLNPSILDTSNLIDTSYMFDGTGSALSYFGNEKSLTIKGIEALDVSNVINMSGMFYETSSLKELNLSNWDVSQVKEMIQMFYHSQIKTLKVNNWVFNKNIKFGKDDYGFLDGATIEKIEGIETWDVSDVTNMSYMFYNASSLTTLDLNDWDTHNVTNMANMFSSASNLTELDLSGLDTQNVTDMSRMFASANLTSLNISNWDTHNVTNMSGMFTFIMGLSELDLGNWNTSKVTNMSGMFYYSMIYRVDGLESFNTSKVENMSKMFMYTGIDELNISNWDTSNVVDMSLMFAHINDPRMSTLDLSNWDTSKVTNMSEMFYFSSQFENIYMQKAIFSQVTSYSNMFGNTNYALKVTITGDDNKKWFLDSMANDINFGLKESQLEVLSE